MAGGMGNCLRILISLHVFRGKLVESRAQIVLHSDSFAALYVAMNPSSRKVLMDELSAELILTQHVQGVLFFEADALSRFSQGASIPASLTNATCLPVPRRNDAFYKAWSKFLGACADTLLGVVCPACVGKHVLFCSRGPFEKTRMSVLNCTCELSCPNRCAFHDG